mgnify:CR=1 FL=1
MFGVRGPAPHRGEHNSGVLEDWLGKDAAQISELHTAQVLQFDEDIGLTAQFVGDHGRLGFDGGDDADAAALALDRVDQPAFINRRLPYAQRGPEIDRWMQRQKMGYSIELIHWHNWRNTVPEELFDEHPDWFALVGGKRVPPIGRYKIETTNPELIAHFAARGVNWFQRDAKRYCFSLSPSDSRGWSQSPESLALTETDKHGNESVTPLVLKFYNDVAGLIYEQNSDRIVSGYIYMDYLYPPKDGVKSLAPNLWLIVAPHISYAYMMYKPEVRLVTRFGTSGQTLARDQFQALQYAPPPGVPW